LGINVEQRNESNVICLEGVIDIASAAELKTLLLDALKSGSGLSVSLDRCTDLDVTAIQLLWAAEREARASSVGFALAGQVPETVSAALKDAGFEAFHVTV
jgi:anti-anti-sigma regulatory factor